MFFRGKTSEEFKVQSQSNILSWILLLLVIGIVLQAALSEERAGF